MAQNARSASHTKSALDAFLRFIACICGNNAHPLVALMEPFDIINQAKRGLK